MAKVAVVTGGNRGIGLEIVRNLCQKFDGDVILTARNRQAGEGAVRKLSEESDVSGPRFHQLDVCDPASIQALADHLNHTYQGLDILVNNAGVMVKSSSSEPLADQVQTTLAVNFWGCLNCCRVLFPYLRPGARVVNVSSVYCRSTLRECSPALKSQLTAPDLTMARLESLMTQYQQCARQGRCQVNGWSTFAYGVSKIGVTLMTAIQQRQMDRRVGNPDILINSCCPGWCRTDLGGDRAPKSAAQGADTPVYLSLLAPGVHSPRGALVSDRTLQTLG